MRRFDTLSKCALYAYMNPDSFEYNWPWETHHEIVTHEHNGSVVHTHMFDDMTVISFRGTEVHDINDICYDMRCLKMRLHVGKVHRGFALAYAQVANKLKDQLELYGGLTRPRIYVTGHSLGAAMASICVAELAKYGVAISGLVTFGSPRVGNAEFGKYVSSVCKVYRFVNNNDAVTRCPLPLGYPGCVYKHFGTQVYYDQTGSVHVNPNWVTKNIDRLTAKFTSGLRIDSISDHSMASYHQLTRKWCNANTQDSVLFTPLYGESHC